MTKAENGMTKEIQMTKHEDVQRSSFGFRPSSFLRHLTFDIRPSDLVFPSSFPFLSRRLFLLLLSAGLLSLSGASCPRTWQRYINPPPRVLPLSPTLVQVIEVVNRNSSQIQSFSTNRAALSGPGYPSLSASVAFERPRRFRLRAGTGLTGPEVDLGSNDELFWFWMRRNQPPAIYYCRHDQFATSQARLTTPFEPGWLIEALGVMEFDPALPHQGPQPLPNERLRIDTIRNTPEGPLTKITIVDSSQGWVLEQHLFDARHQLLARSVADGHRQDPLSGLIMPTTVNLDLPPSKLSLRIDLGNVEINRLSGDRASLWSMPSYPGAAPVNLADPNFRLPGAPAPVAVPSPGPPPGR
jgi:hypothetical protein